MNMHKNMFKSFLKIYKIISSSKMKAIGQTDIKEIVMAGFNNF